MERNSTRVNKQTNNKTEAESKNNQHIFGKFHWYYLRCGLYFIRIYVVLYHLLKVFLSRRKQFLSQVFFKAIKQLQIVFTTLYIVVINRIHAVCVKRFSKLQNSSFFFSRSVILKFMQRKDCTSLYHLYFNLKTSIVLFSAHELVCKIKCQAQAQLLTLPRPRSFVWRALDYRASAKNVLVTGNTVVGCVS